MNPAGTHACEARLLIWTLLSAASAATIAHAFVLLPPSDPSCLDPMGSDPGTCPQQSFATTHKDLEKYTVIEAIRYMQLGVMASDLTRCAGEYNPEHVFWPPTWPACKAGWFFPPRCALTAKMSQVAGSAADRGAVVVEQTFEDGAVRLNMLPLLRGLPANRTGALTVRSGTSCAAGGGAGGALVVTPVASGTGVWRTPAPVSGCEDDDEAVKAAAKEFGVPEQPGKPATCANLVGEANAATAATACAQPLVRAACRKACLECTAEASADKPAAALPVPFAVAFAAANKGKVLNDVAGMVVVAHATPDPASAPLACGVLAALPADGARHTFRGALSHIGAQSGGTDPHRPSTPQIRSQRLRISE